MGEAKRRGTKEQRVENAIARHQAEMAEQIRIRKERQRINDLEDDLRDAAMTQKQRKISRLFLAQMMALAMATRL